jgi:hypothetical protein
LDAPRLVAGCGADCAVAPWDGGPDVSLGEDVARCESPVGVCLTGVGRGGALGVVMLGVVMLGVVMPDVVTLGVVTLGVVTAGVLTEGTVTAGTLTVGTDTVGTLIVGTLIVGMLIVGIEAAQDAAVTSSAPHARSTAAPCRWTHRRTSD